MTGITLMDNDASGSDHQEDGSDEEDPPSLPQRHPPPLPPRPRTFSETEDERPSLPPRLRSSTIAAIPISSPTTSPSNDVDNCVKRKPAPTVHPLPRYSMIVGTSSQQLPATLGHIPFYNTVEQPFEEEEEQGLDVDSDLPEYEAVPESSNRTAIPRKPVPKSLKGDL